MEMGDLQVLGHRIPAALEVLLKEGRWVPPADEQVFLEIFGERPNEAHFFDLSELVRCNELWRELEPLDIFWEPEVDTSLGIDLRLSVLIGVLGTDMPFVLDYRESDVVPRVLYLASSDGFAWVQVASDVEDLIHRLDV
ncbi:hypothetical protein [Actinomadura meyerae]|uniref:hypothetical protein n=1 Tax=Actinomadura meyerae TaxID=240840 RepID=UPI0011775276|nr:hypothetical protein [Actinomadura meyerae]